MAGESIYIDVDSPFGLPKPTPGWLAVIAEFDPDLRIFPSKTHPVYRLMRRAHNTPMSATLERMQTAQNKGILKELHPDTAIAIHYGLVSVSTLPKEAITVSPEQIVERLMRRDQWRFKDGDAVADHLDKRDADHEKEIAREQKRDLRERRKAAGVSLLYRTGGRVSLVRPSRHIAGSDALGTPGGTEKPASVSPTE